MTADVLILNRNFFALEVTTWQRAMSLLVLDRAIVVDDEYRTYEFADWVDLSQKIAEHPAGFVHTPNIRIAIPEVIALKFFEKVPRRQVPFTRRNIYQHYGNRCCYCNKHFPPADLNLEHILPRSRGGVSDWTNVVTACIRCNLKKGNRTPSEAHMKLVVQPSRPKWRTGAALLVRSPVPIRRSWQRFIDNVYWDAQLEE
ncbi:MAG: HNH endonuclease [Elusimicrobia bacterium]|nr:HNH endonuclease [Elusimicrobiota bacterium]